MNDTNDSNNFLKELIKAIILAIVTAMTTGIITNHFTKENTVKAITKAMSTRFDFIDEKMSYEQALDAVYKEVQNSKNEIASLNEQINERNSLIEQQNSVEEIDKIIKNATEYWNEGDYQQCLTLLKNSKSRSTDIDSLYEKYSTDYTLKLLSEADSLVAKRKYDKAIELLEDGKLLVNDDKMIIDKIDDLNDNQPVKLADLKITASRFFDQNQDKPLVDTVGNKYSAGNSFIMYAEGESGYGYGTFYLGKKYTSLSGVIAVSDESENHDDVQLKGWVEIGTKSNNDDFNSLWTSAMLSRTTSQIEIPELNIKDSEWIEIRYYSNGDYYSLAEGYHSLQIIISDMTLYVD